MLGFYLKKIVSRFFFPIPLCLELLIPGLLLLWLAKKPRARKAGKSLVTAGTVLLFLFSWGPVSSRMLRPIERQYRAFDPNTVDPGIKYVVLVLGQGLSKDPDLPVEQRVNETLVARLVEGTRVYRRVAAKGAGCTLLVSMAGLASEAEKLAFLNDFERTVKLPEKTCEPILDALDTDDELRIAGERYPYTTIIIASSASHIPRAMMIARRLGLSVIPAPTVPECQSGPSVVWSIAPKSRAIYRTERAIYEYMGMTWEWGKARFSHKPLNESK